MKKQANERTFQGILLTVISEIIIENTDLNFSQITQEENIGEGAQQRFADGLLYSATSKNIRILFELKNTKWEATDDKLVEDALFKASGAKIDFYVTGTPRQLAIYKTFEPDKTAQERRIEIVTISRIRRDDEVKTENFKSTIKNALKIFLKKLSDIVHGVREITYDTINNLYINRLSAYISEASESMWDLMYDKINSDKLFKRQLQDYLRNQDIFNLTQSFDYDDVYKLCQLSNYILYLKILFYCDLQRNVPELKLRPIVVPEDKLLLNSTLQNRFADVLEHDYEMIFTPSIIDEFEFQQEYLSDLRRNVETVKTLNYKDLNADIIGAIYNVLIDNQEQHDRGQHFTNTNEVDIINAFCINENTKYVIDTSCGAGTFLVRAYQFLKYYQPKLLHTQLLERVWGVEIATFPAFLSVMNLCLLNIRTTDNYPLIIRSDFAKITPNYFYSGYFLNANKEFEITKLDNRQKKVKLPVFDACVGNPPYIRQELIENKDDWNSLIKNEYGIKKINQQSDFYVFYLMHTASFLREGGRFGYVISSSWLDVSFGRDLQKFLLDNFKIVAIIDNQVKRSFETASINSVILILEKCSNKSEREINNVKFVRIYKNYEDFIGNTWKEGRIDKVNHFVQTLEKTYKNIENKNYNVFIINQETLESESTINEKYTNGHWGAKYLRSPKIYEKILEMAGSKLVKVSDACEITRGFTTGANDFFYVEEQSENLKKYTDENYKIKMGASREKHKTHWDKMGWFYSELTNVCYEIERNYTKPLFKTQKEAENLDVNVSKLENYVIFCAEERKKLSSNKNKILKYIKEAENLNINKRPTLTNKEKWYDITNLSTIGDFIFPSKIGEKFRLIDNRKAKVYCDKVNYAIVVNNSYSTYKDIIFLILNSTLFRFFIDLFSRQLTGAQTLSDVDVNVVESALIINPKLLIPFKSELEEIYNSLKSREQGTIFEEVGKPDRRRLDELIFKVLGLESKDVDELYKAVCAYVSNRKQKSESVENTKKKQKFSYDETISFIKERFTEIRPIHILIQNIQTKTIKIPAQNPKYPKVSNGNGNIFDNYQIYFTDNAEKIIIELENSSQLEYLRYLIDYFEVKNTEIEIPVNENDCNEILQKIKFDYNKYAEQIKNTLKSHRISANYINIYKELLFQ